MTRPNDRHSSARARPAAASTGARRQRGLGLFGLLIGAAVLAAAALIGMQVVPTVIEFMAVKRAANRAVDEADSVAQVQAAFDRYAAIDDIKALTGRDLVIDRDPKTGKWVAQFQYTRTIELFGPASLLLDYRGNTAER
jgi:hypothetical protein